MKLQNLPSGRPLFFDGSMGVLLQEYRSCGINPDGSSEPLEWTIPEELNIHRPAVIAAVHRAYLEAGADVVLTNTFGSFPSKLQEHGLDPAECVAAACRIARSATEGFPHALVALDLGPTGKLLEPMGSLSFEEAIEAYAVQVRAGAPLADLVLIETISDLYELKAALIAVRENCSLPVIASVTFQPNDRTLSGADPRTVAALAESLGAAAVGFNCGGDLDQAIRLTTAFAGYAGIPVFAEPNAGLPVMENGSTVFKVSPEDFAYTLEACVSAGAGIIGGCCGTRPEHIAAMTKQCRTSTPRNSVEHTRTEVTSWSKTVQIGVQPVIIGERINPTGKKKLKEALLNRNMDYLLSEGAAQVQSGADILDVNVGLPGIDEAAVMCEAVKILQQTWPVPLQIDSSEPVVLERALRLYNGKPLVNSVNGKSSVMKSVFPLIARYGGVIVALTLDEDGIPPTAQGRLAIAKKIVETAESYGIKRRDILIDTLTLTVSSQQKEAMETVHAIRMVKEQLGVHTVLGVSNISFGLPRRDVISPVFLTAALSAGLDSCIINPLSEPMMDVLRSWRALTATDENCMEYISWFSSRPTPDAQQAATTRATGSTGTGTHTGEPAPDDLAGIIISGLRDRSARAAELLLQRISPLEIIDTCIVPALDIVGKEYEAGSRFLPQLLLSADTVSKAFTVIREHLAASGQAGQSRGTILMATVEGDIHDIGKNIVKAMLENYGYTVIDLGKDVPVSMVVERAAADTPGLIGLSALMTTTVANMEKTIQALRDAGISCPVMVGGAVLTEDYASRIGADYYAADAMASVRIAKEVFGK